LLSLVEKEKPAEDKNKVEINPTKKAVIGMPGGMRRLDGLDEFGMIAGFTPKGVDFYKEL
jgi:hypothetical protein